ncbi:MAG: hypothetical protein IPG51_08010 [Chloroflexi bacterium]|nr:hypothetical protein [Chloroflexota bacterium]
MVRRRLGRAYPAAPEETTAPEAQPSAETAVTPMPTALPAVPAATTPIENAPAPTVENGRGGRRNGRGG